MSMHDKKRDLIQRLFEIVGACVKAQDYFSARLYQRDLILLMMQDSRFTNSQIADAYFALAEFCEKVGDYKGVNKFAARATSFRKAAITGKTNGLAQFIERRSEQMTGKTNSIEMKLGSSNRFQAANF
ncbi:MAG: hypothetical protein C0507_21920 [Cyanobacteria bacterium PR.3.49]|nr:hypothetical protein [Cyanobacteria bacterium PR.3.49]